MPLYDNVIAAQASLNERAEIEWRCSIFARRHLRSSELELRREIDGIARGLRAAKIDDLLTRREHHIAEALIRVAQSLIDAKHAPPVPATIGTRGELRLEYQLKARLHPKHRRIPAARTTEEQDKIEQMWAGWEHMNQLAHEQHMRDLEKELAEDPMVMSLKAARNLAREDQRQLKQELDRAEKGSGPPIDEAKVKDLLAEMLTSEQEADALQDSLTAKYNIKIGGEYDESGAWQSIDEESPPLSNAIVGRALVAIAKRRLDLASIREPLRPRSPLGPLGHEARFDAEKARKGLLNALSVEKDVQAAGARAEIDSKMNELELGLLNQNAAQIVRDLRRADMEVYWLKKDIKRAELENRNHQLVDNLSDQLSKKLELILQRRREFIVNHNQQQLLTGESLTAAELAEIFKGDIGEGISIGEIEAAQKVRKPPEN